MNNKPKMYQNNPKKEFHNNKNVYMSYDKNDNDLDGNSVKNINDIRRRVNDIINSNNFIYSKTVHLIVGNDTITRKIIGIFGNNVVTIDNEYIPLDNIKDIYV